MNIVRFDLNVPTNVTLQSSEGVCVEGHYGTRLMFMLADGRAMYVPPIVASKIEAAGIAAGESFQLCKASIKTGQKRSVEWSIARIAPEQDRPLVAECMTTTTSETSLEHDLRLSVEMANAKRAGIEPPANCIEEIPSFSPPGNGHSSNGNGSGLKLVPNVLPPPVTKLEHALKTAISAAHNAEKFGSELGYVVRFDADAIKSMAITVLINMSERAQR